MVRYKTKTRPGLVALYDIRPGNGAGPFLQPRSPHGACQCMCAGIGHCIRNGINMDISALFSRLSGAKKNAKLEVSTTQVMEFEGHSWCSIFMQNSFITV